MNSWTDPQVFTTFFFFQLPSKKKKKQKNSEETTNDSQEYIPFDYSKTDMKKFSGIQSPLPMNARG